MGCGADTEANELIESLLDGVDLNIPDIDLDDPIFDLPGDVTSPIYQAIQKLKNSDLTTATIDGSGTFDVLMRGFKVHLKDEYSNNRITGAEYTKAYIELTQAAMGNATQFLLGRDQAYWAAQLAQMQAITARVGLATAKVQLAALQYEALNAEATYALTKMKLASESAAYCNAKFQLEQLLPEQLKLIKEQVEVQRSQTLDTRTDGAAIVGSVGKQKALYTQQITSYQRDAEVKAAKLFTDAWITMKTIDEGLLPPAAFQNTSLNTILENVKTNNDLD